MVLVVVRLEKQHSKNLLESRTGPFIFGVCATTKRFPKIDLNF